mgnify:CR=1 FL=1
MTIIGGKVGSHEERNDVSDKTTNEELRSSTKITKHVRQVEEKKQGTRMLKNERNHEERNKYREKGSTEKCRRGAARTQEEQRGRKRVARKQWRKNSGGQKK